MNDSFYLDPDGALDADKVNTANNVPDHALKVIFRRHQPKIECLRVLIGAGMTSPAIICALGSTLDEVRTMLGFDPALSAIFGSSPLAKAGILGPLLIVWEDCKAEHDMITKRRSEANLDLVSNAIAVPEDTRIPLDINAYREVGEAQITDVPIVPLAGHALRCPLSDAPDFSNEDTEDEDGNTAQLLASRAAAKAPALNLTTEELALRRRNWDAALRASRRLPQQLSRPPPSHGQGRPVFDHSQIVPWTDVDGNASGSSSNRNSGDKCVAPNQISPEERAKRLRQHWSDQAAYWSGEERKGQAARAKKAAAQAAAQITKAR